MYKYFLLLSLLFLFSCKSSKDLSNHEGNRGKISIISAKYNNWVSGSKGHGSGVEFYFDVLVKNEAVNVGELIVGNKRYKTISKVKGTSKYYEMNSRSFKLNDTIKIRASGNEHYNNEELSIEILVGEKREKIKINKIEEIKGVKYQ